MSEDACKSINISVQRTIWHALSITSAKLGLHKREAVEKAILEFIQKHDPDSLRFLNGQIPD